MATSAKTWFIPLLSLLILPIFHDCEFGFRYRSSNIGLKNGRSHEFWINEFQKDRSNRSALFDTIEEGGIRASMYPHDVNEHDNEKALDELHGRVDILKSLTSDVHEEVELHNRKLDRMGNDMDASRGTLSGTIDRFKTVFKTKSSRRMFKLVMSFVVLFLVLYYLMKFI